MNNRKHIYFWGTVFAFFVIFVTIFKSILLPFVLGLILGYLLDPLADRLVRIKFPRSIAALLVLFLFFLTLFMILALFWPVLKAQIDQMAEILPKYIERLQLFVSMSADRYLGQYGGQELFDAENVSEKYGEQILQWSADTAKNIWSGGAALFNILSLLVITPVVAFFLLRDWKRLVSKVDEFLPLADRPLIHRIMKDIDLTLAGFIRGQALVCLVLGIFYAAGLTLVGLNFGLIIGLFIGLISFIPFVGAIFGGLLCVALALLQFASPGPTIAVLVVFLIGQFIEGNVLQPKLVGDNVNLHPVWIIFALLAGGSLMGFTGVMIAVPVAAILGVLARYAVGYYLKAEVYRESHKAALTKKQPAKTVKKKK